MNRVFLAAVGDVLVDRSDPGRALSGVRPLLGAADVTFGNFEGVLTDKYSVAPGASRSSVVPPRNAEGVAGFDVMSLANNHSMDAGEGGLADTMSALTRLGVRPVGAGKNLDAALATVIVETSGPRVALLAVTAVLQHGAEARPGVPGVAPLRADDAYLPMYPGVRCPGVTPRIVSILDETDWERLAVVIGEAKRNADLVVVSVHWGDHTRPWVLTDHERLCAELIIDAGADLILGHHHHMMRGMDFVGGKPVFYGLGHIVFDYPRFADELASYGFDTSALSSEQLVTAFGEYGIFPRPEHPSFPFHPMARHAGVAVLEIDADGVRSCGIVPCFINQEGIALPVNREDDNWPQMLDFLRKCQSRAGLSATVEDKGTEFGGHPMVEFIPAL